MTNESPNTRLSIGVLAGLSMVVGGASLPANATVISYSTTFNSGLTGSVSDSTAADGPEDNDQFSFINISLPQFDSTLGTLTGVRYSLTSFLESSVNLTVTGSGEFSSQGSVLVAYGQKLRDAIVGDFLDNGVPTPTVDLECTSPITGTCNKSGFISPNIPDGSSHSFTGPILTGYIGTNFIDVIVQELTLFEVDLISGDGMAQGSFNTSWNGTLAVEYTYDSAPVVAAVPEPMTWSLMGAGLAGLAVARRRVAKR